MPETGKRHPCPWVVVVVLPCDAFAITSSSGAGGPPTSGRVRRDDLASSISSADVGA